MCLERQDGRVCKRYTENVLMEVIKDIIEWEKIDCIILESWIDEVYEYE